MSAVATEVQMPITAQTMEWHWLPFTDNRGFKRDPRLLVRALGMHYWNEPGDNILGSSSGLFTSAAGHCRPGIARVVGKQLRARRFDRGLHVKTTDDVAIVAPPFIARREDIDQIAAILRDALSEY